MAAIANIVLTDSVAADHTFVPVQASPARSKWLDTAFDSRRYLCPSLEALFKEAANKGEVQRSEHRIAMPLFTEDAEGLVTSRGTARLIIQVICPSDMSTLEKADLKAYGRDLIDETVWADYVDGSPAY